MRKGAFETRVKVLLFAGTTLFALVTANAGQPAPLANATDSLVQDAEYDRIAGKTAACIAEYTQVLILRADQVDAYVGRAGCETDAGDLMSALGDYGQAMRVHPGDASLYVLRGSASQQAGLVTAAAADFKKVGELASATPDQLNQAAAGLTAFKFYVAALDRKSVV